MAVIVLRSVKGSPLTIAEADANFSNLNTEVGVKLDAADYTAADVLTKIKTLDGSTSGLDADLLDGLNASNSHVNSTATVVSRDTAGNFSANTVTANLVGNVTGNVVGNVTGTLSGNATNVSGIVSVSNGGTGATTVAAARTALGLGTTAVQDTSAVNITGGTITGITDLAIADGGTGASTTTQARTNLGLVIGSDIQPFSNQLTAVSALASNGLIIRSGSATIVARSIAAGAGLTATNGDGVSGNPTLALSTTYNSQLNSLVEITTSGLIIRNGAQSAISRSIAGGNSISVSNGDGVSGNPTIALSSSPTVSSIVKGGSNGSGDIGQSDNRFGTIYGTATSARYADLAEKYTTDQEYEAGTVLVVAVAGDAESTASHTTGQRVLGVVSTNPAFLMNDEAPGQAIALRGRVPVKVIGPVKKGQALICNQDGKGIVGDTQNSFAIALESNAEYSVKLVECVIL